MELTDIRRGRQDGFSVIETLMALFLLVVGVTAVATGLTEGRRLAAEAGNRQRAIWSAHDKLTEKLARGYDAARTPADASERVIDGTLTGEDQTNAIRRRWWVEGGWEGPELLRVVVVAEWMRRGQLQSYLVSGLIADGRTQ